MSYERYILIPVQVTIFPHEWLSRRGEKKFHHALCVNSDLNKKLDYIYKIDIFGMLVMRGFQKCKNF